MLAVEQIDLPKLRLVPAAEVLLKDGYEITTNDMPLFTEMEVVLTKYGVVVDKWYCSKGEEFKAQFKEVLDAITQIVRKK